MAITLDGTNGITTPDVIATSQSSNFVTTGNISAADLTLSGGVYLGGTGAANKLDDYEEGTWTPSMSVNGFTQTPSGFSVATYRKIGDIVYIECAVSFSPAAYASSWGRISGFPFTTVASAAAAYSSGSISDNARGGPSFITDQSFYFFPADNANVSTTWTFSGVFRPA